MSKFNFLRYYFYVCRFVTIYSQTTLLPTLVEGSQKKPLSNPCPPPHGPVPKCLSPCRRWPRCGSRATETNRYGVDRRPFFELFLSTVFNLFPHLRCEWCFFGGFVFDSLFSKLFPNLDVVYQWRFCFSFNSLFYKFLPLLDS